MSHKPAPDAPATQRLDQWLWCVRVVKTRTLAASLVAGGKVRVNRERTDKPAKLVRRDDVVTVVVGPRVRVLRVLGTAERRGSAPEASLLFEDLTPVASPPAGTASTQAGSSPSAGASAPTSGRRPTKRERRDLVRLKDRHGDDTYSPDHA